MTFFNINNPFIQAPSQSYLWTYLIKVVIFYPILYWGIYRHIVKTKLKFPFYLILAIVFVFLQPNLFLNDIIVTIVAIGSVYYFANPNEESLTSIVAKFGVTMLVYYFASFIGLIGSRWIITALPQTSAVLYFLLVPIIYLIALVVIHLSRSIFDHYFLIILERNSGISYLLFLMFVPISYVFYVFQYNAYLIGHVFHIKNVNLFTLILAVGYYLCCLLIIHLVTKILVMQNQLSYANLRFKNLENYTSELEVLYDDMRRFKHDYKNILYSLMGALNSNRIDYAKSVLRKLTGSTNSLINLPTQVLGNLQNIKDTGIKSAIYGKIDKALQADLSVTIEVDEPIDLTDTLSQIDAIRIISILMDNAINAASQSKKQEINLTIYENDNAQFIIVGNTTRDAQVNLQELDEHSKAFVLKASHQLGLRNLRVILGRYSNAINDRSSNNYWFEQRIVIPKSKR